MRILAKLYLGEFSFWDAKYSCCHSLIWCSMLSVCDVMKHNIRCLIGYGAFAPIRSICTTGSTSLTDHFSSFFNQSKVKDLLCDQGTSWDFSSCSL